MVDCVASVVEDGATDLEAMADGLACKSPKILRKSRLKAAVSICIISHLYVCTTSHNKLQNNIII